MNNTIAIGEIGKWDGALSADQFTAELEACDPKETLYLDIHSEGGSVFEGFSIARKLQDWTGKVVARVKTAAFSIASYIAMSCDEIEIAANGYFMVHNPWSETAGDAKQHARNQKLLSQMQTEMMATYAARTGISEDKIAKLMDEETFIDAHESVATGWADRVLESQIPKRKMPESKCPAQVFAAMYSPNKTLISKQEAADMPATKTAASVSAIKAAFPKASSDFIVLCMEKEMAMEDVGEEYAKAMEEENEKLKAEVSELEEKLAKFETKAKEDEENPAPNASNNKPGHMPVNPTGSANRNDVDPKDEWNDLVDSFKAKGHAPAKAVSLANKANPGLRQRLVDMANQR